MSSAYLGDGDAFGSCVANLGDLDWDGDDDFMVGAKSYQASSERPGAVVVIRMPGNSPLPPMFQLITQGQGGLQATLRDSARFGAACTGLGPLNHDDEIPDAAVAATEMTALRGSIFTLFLNTDGTVNSEVEVHEGSHPPLMSLSVSNGELLGSFISSGPPPSSDTTS